MLKSDPKDALELLTGELRNFQEIAKNILPLPGEIPTLEGIDVYGGTIPLNGSLGGDHIIYVDFKKRYDLPARIKRAASENRIDIIRILERCQRTAGIAVLDAAGHQATDALLAAMLHQAFLLGSIYELDMFGEITRHLFENLNTRFYNSSSLNKYVTMIYGEISEDMTFRFLSAAHPAPIVFSQQHDRFMQISEELCTSFPPIGTLPSGSVIDRNRSQSVLGFKDRYELNEWKLMGAGDILLMCTDGLLESYYPAHLEAAIRRVKHLSARQIFESIRTDFLEFAPPTDDASFVVIKRT